MAEVQSSTQAGETAARFIEFVQMQSQNAALFLGLIPNPGSGQPEVNLDLARMFIDQLAMIGEKTRGNLSTEETKILRNALTNLQMAYFEVSQGGGETPEPIDAPRAGGDRTRASDSHSRARARIRGGCAVRAAGRVARKQETLHEKLRQLRRFSGRAMRLDSDLNQTISSLIYGDRRKSDGAAPLLFILGPCVIESEKFLRDTAREIKAVCDERGATWVLKASYDKANRTSGRSYRGMPAREGCELLAAVGRELGVATTTDVHSPAEAELAAEWIDVLQIPAFLCRQTDLIQTAAATGRVGQRQERTVSSRPGMSGPSPRSCRQRAAPNFSSPSAG